MDSDDNSEEWATEELPPFPSTNQLEQNQPTFVFDDSYWETKPVDLDQNRHDANSDAEGLEGHPMILVDFTVLSSGTIHCKFDAKSVNDPMAVKDLRSSIEKSYNKYASDAALLAERTVVPCGSSVWRPALQSLRMEKPGHYFCPIFPLVEDKT
mmetsp:Transcript_28214/g.43048  ORF Transcript_28214/g.43048 Transcript_28214/m.43048 type:complete len:154 (-) Transcript_28214:1783-2244(-)